MKRVVEMGAEVVGSPPERSAQIGTAYVADEQGVAGEDRVRVRRVFAEIEHQDRNRLDGVAGSLEHLQAQSGEVESIAVLHGDESVFRLGARAKMDGRAATIAQLQVTGN